MSQALQRLAKELQALDAADEAVAIYTEFAAKPADTTRPSPVPCFSSQACWRA